MTIPVKGERGADFDAALEYAAQLIEEPSIIDYCGIAAPNKRDREDAELRRKTAAETRIKCAELIRAFKSRRDLDAIEVLRGLSELAESKPHDLHLINAWPLAWKGWLTISCTIKCNSNSIPPETKYHIELTEEGRAALNEARK